MNDDVTVRDIMSREFVGVSESDDLRDVVDVLVDEEATVAAAVRGSQPVGIVTEQDLLSLVPDDPGNATVSDFMRDPKPVVSPEMPFVAALNYMSTQGTRRLLVTDGDGELVGVLTADDALTAASSLLENGATVEDGDRVVTTAGATGTATAAEQADDGYSSQSVCESCGSLTHELTNFNGQLICADCRDV